MVHPPKPRDYSQKVNRKVLPGYILVRMDLNDESSGAVRNTICRRSTASGRVTGPIATRWRDSLAVVLTAPGVSSAKA